LTRLSDNGRAPIEAYSENMREVLPGFGD